MRFNWRKVKLLFAACPEKRDLLVYNSSIQCDICHLISARYLISQFLQTELSVFPSMVYCLNLVSWCTAYLRDLFLD